MKKLILLIVFIIIAINLNFSEEMKIINLAITPVNFISDNLELNNLKEFITDTLKNEATKEKANVIILEFIKNSQDYTDDNILKISNDKNADIVIFGNCIIQKGTLIILLNSYDVKNKKLLFYNTFQSIINKENIAEKLENFLKNFINKIEEITPFSIQKYSGFIDFSIGYEMSPLTYETKFSAMKIKNYSYDNAHNFLGIRYLNDYSFNFKWMVVGLSFSFSYFINDNSSVGFNSSFYYSAGILNSGLISYNSSYMHSIGGNISFRIKYGKPIKPFRFIFEFGILDETEILNQLIENTSGVNYKYFGNFFTGLGPILSLGFEARRNNFSFEFLGFISGTFGWESIEHEFVIDPNAYNINVSTGILLRFNFYKLIKIKKT